MLALVFIEIVLIFFLIPLGTAPNPLDLVGTFFLFALLFSFLFLTKKRLSFNLNRFKNILKISFHQFFIIKNRTLYDILESLCNFQLMNSLCIFHQEFHLLLFFFNNIEELFNIFALLFSLL